MEAPLKFQAPNITTALGLGIGKIIFKALSIMEWIISSLIITSLFFIKPNRKIWILYLLPISIFIIQNIWLLPILMERADMVISNEPLPESYYHFIYGILEVIKFLLIIRAGIIFLTKAIQSVQK